MKNLILTLTIAAIPTISLAQLQSGNLAEPQYQLTGQNYSSEAGNIQQMFYNTAGAVNQIQGEISLIVSQNKSDSNYPPISTYQVLTSGTAATYTTPANARQLSIRMVGGGGGGAAADTNNGSAGGTTIFNSINANGGGGGVTGGFGSAGGAGGSGGSGSASLRIPGQSGQSPPLGPTNVGVEGAGGNSILGFGAPGTQASHGNVAGIAAPINSGAGGSSGATSSSGGGGGGGEYVEIIINSPSATYTYTIGAAGGGGAAGTEAGGNGGLGIIIVEERY